MLSFVLLGCILAIATRAVPWGAWILFGNSATFVGAACRKLAYPELTQEQLYAPEPPLTMFPK
jgi:hypothetical protein